MVDVAKARMFGMDVGTFRWDSAYDVARFEYSTVYRQKISSAIFTSRRDVPSYGVQCSCQKSR